MSSRPWFDSGPVREALNQRIADGLFIEFSAPHDPSRKHVGRVIRTIYVGYKVLLPSGDEVNVNPTVDDVREFQDVSEYEAAASRWAREDGVIREEARVRGQMEAARLQAILDRQSACLHESIYEDPIARVAGCDIDDIVCTACEKRLLRSWCTAYDTDPKSEVSDWEWYLRYCKKKYNGYVPAVDDYKLVSKIGTEMFR